jgi:hypothetical protein
MDNNATALIRGTESRPKNFVIAEENRNTKKRKMKIRKRLSLYQPRAPRAAYGKTGKQGHSTMAPRDFDRLGIAKFPRPRYSLDLAPYNLSRFGTLKKCWKD